MKKLTFIIIGFFALQFLLHSCEEIYYPAIDQMPQLIVVDAHITNDSKQNYVMVFKTRNFNSTSAVEWISGALVELVADNFKIVKAVEGTPGHYSFPSTPVAGMNYKLRITNLEDVFESDYVTMPPIPTIDTIFTKDVIQKEIRLNGYGAPETFELPGREIDVNAAITPQLKYFRFDFRAILQWKYIPRVPYDSTMNVPEDSLKHALIDAAAPPPATPDTAIHVIFGWKSIYDKSLYNLAGPKEFSTSDKLENHRILFLTYIPQQYLDSLQQSFQNWIIFIDQFGITEESYKYHEKLNQQFSAQGSLFDPAETQVYGNIHCVNDPSRIVLGFFDLNSYIQRRYYFNLGSGQDQTVKLRKLNTNYEIPEWGSTKKKPPVFWEYDY